MEIIHVVQGKVNPIKMNDVNKAVCQLANTQVGNGEKVSVWGISKSIKKNYEDQNFKTKLFKSCLNPFRVDTELVKYIESKKGTAVFHIHGDWIPTFATITKILSRNNIPYTFTSYDSSNMAEMDQESMCSVL